MLGFFYFFLIEFNIPRNAQSSLAPRRKRKKNLNNIHWPCHHVLPNKHSQTNAGDDKLAQEQWDGGAVTARSRAQRLGLTETGSRSWGENLLKVGIGHTWQVWGAQSKKIIAFCCVMGAQLSQPAANQDQREALLRPSIWLLSKGGS